MASTVETAPVSKTALYLGWALTIIPSLLLLFSGGMKLMQPPEVIEGLEHLGYPVSVALGLGIVEIACTVLYLIPRTSVLGAILLTGYLGGATASHLRLSEPYFMPILIGVVLWGGLFLRDLSIRQLIPLRR